MDYRYTNEDTMDVAITITLGELDNVISILGPISKDDGHDGRYTAADLNRKFEDIRAAMIKTAADNLGYRASVLNK